MGFQIDGDVTVPGDKSLTHRALMFAAAARGVSRLRGLLPGEDCRSTANVLRSLGVPVPELPMSGGEIQVRSEGLGQWIAPSQTLDCGNSGTTARLMMGLLAGRQFCASLDGDASLRSRPMRRITEPLGMMGAKVRELGLPDRLPLEICGAPLQGLRYRSPKASAQIKSAILLAGLSSRVPVAVWEAIRSRDHTERMLSSLGIQISETAEEGGWLVIATPPNSELPPLDMEVPGDPSSASFLMALAAMADAGELRIRNVGLNPTRTGFFDCLRRMGVRVETENARSSGGEQVGDLVLTPGQLHATSVTAADVPAMIDELPMLACLAARADGETTITGAEELRTKESDRITVLVDNLRAIGADADELPDGLVVRGSTHPLSGRVRASHDHRIAMAFGVLGAHPDNRIEIDTPAVVDVSFPGFWSLLREIVVEESRTA